MIRSTLRGIALCRGADRDERERGTDVACEQREEGVAADAEADVDGPGDAGRPQHVRRVEPEAHHAELRLVVPRDAVAAEVGDDRAVAAARELVGDGAPVELARARPAVQEEHRHARAALHEGDAPAGDGDLEDGPGAAWRDCCSTNHSVDSRSCDVAART